MALPLRSFSVPRMDRFSHVPLQTPSSEHSETTPEDSQPIWRRLAALFPHWPAEYLAHFILLLQRTTSRIFRKIRKPRAQRKPEKTRLRLPALTIPNTVAPVLPSIPKKKALLIGINYESDGNSAPLLSGPHHDVQELKELLLDPSMFGYSRDDIVVMMDDQASRGGPLEPTRENILTQISKLVQDAQRGDHFFFHYSGFSDQIENKDKTEEDGQDEVIIACDRNPDDSYKYIVDDDLRKLLVNVLPIGSSLVALFDSCHSGSLLDLPHSHCNRAYIPWVSKGKRRTGTLKNRMVRKQAMPLKSNSGHSKIYESLHTGITSLVSLMSSLDPQPGAQHMSLSALYQSTTDAFPKDTGADSESFGSPIFRCSSPDPIFPCTGDCLPDPTEMPHVISLSASQDNQKCWEDADGKSMTKIVIEILRKNPHPTLRNLLELVSHDVYDISMRLHKNHRALRHEQRASEGEESGVDATEFETDNFQDPQLSSLKPLDMNARFTL